MLSTELWERLQSLFHAAVDRPRAEWRSFLESETANDDIVITRVMAMLEADAADGTVLGREASTLANELLDTSTSAIGRRVGPYHITGLLGEGGMGVVYRAVREDLGTQAAVTVIRYAWGSHSRGEMCAIERCSVVQLNLSAVLTL